MLKIGLALAIAAAAAAVLVVAASGARERGKNTYCRNNLRKLGEMAWDKLEGRNQDSATGRKFWQELRVELWTTVKGGEKKWFVRFGGLNPFGCPVRAVQPLDLSALSPEELDRVMSDPATIDYRGPTQPQGIRSTRRARPLGADLAGNHPHGGGHVLLVDLSVTEVREAITFKDLRDAAGADTELSE